MKKSGWRYSRYALGLLAVVFALAAIHWLGSSGLLQPAAVEAKITLDTAPFDPVPAVLDRAHPGVQAAMAAQNRHNPHLLALPDVVGTATGVNEAGKPAIKVFTKRTVPPGLIPESLDGIPVAVEVTGEIFALAKPSGTVKINPTQRFDRAVPIGVSTGNEGECSAGTIGARVKKGSDVYALSNNHVYALENDAPIGSQVLQPGRYDTSCSFSENNVIGTLDAFVEIDFSGTPSNVVDAAIALSSTANLGNATPANGYGTPKSSPAAAVIYQAVQKYGRTTSLTKGTVTAINGTIKVSYTAGIATFVNQIVVQSNKPFIKAGDSGSLLVTDQRNPVGLLFAGDSSGKYAIANPIGPVLDKFQVVIDGE